MVIIVRLLIGEIMKQVIVIRNDLNMSTGKLAAQACHASLGSFKKINRLMSKKWEIEGEKKVVVKVDGLEQLLKLEKKVKRSNIPYYLVRDAGLTELPESTITCIGIGPAADEKIDRITKDLKLFK
jgi:peptidyl-tRNA hydrolase, PTH2 family